MPADSASQPAAGLRHPRRAAERRRQAWMVTHVGAGYSTTPTRAQMQS